MKTFKEFTAQQAAIAIAKKKSGNYDKDGKRKTPYKNPDHPSIKKEETIHEAGGASAGTHELVSTKVEKAKEYVSKKYPDFDIDKEIPDFEKNYKFAQKMAKGGFAKRKDMPVIDNKDIKLLQKRLSQGKVDISEPFADNDVPNDPFPQGLDTKKGKQWITHGLRDGDKDDDKVDVKIKSVSVGNLKPIQKQIYFDKSIKNVAQFGAQGTRDFASSKNNFYVISKDNRIIDGHHRFLSAVLVDPKIKVSALQIDLPIDKLLPMTLSYTDAIGNVRNEEVILEVDSLQTRMKKRAAFRKNKNKILAKRKRAMKKVILDPAKLQLRARKQARNILIKKWMRDADRSEMGIGMKKQLEKRLQSKQAVIAKIAKKLLPIVRKKELEKKKPKPKNAISGLEQNPKNSK